MLDELSVMEIARRCREETARYLRGNLSLDQFCMELFRRALVLHDEAAWAYLYRQYADMVRHWLGAHREATLDAAVSGVFTRFWKAVDGAKFLSFTSLAGVLKYLKMCARATLLDEARHVSTLAGEQPLDDTYRESATSASAEAHVAEQLDAQAFWAEIKNILTDERERTVIELTFLIGLRPREICRLRSSDFPDIDEIYRLKRSALDRLRRELGGRERRDIP
jgi:hypothetical protein